MYSRQSVRGPNEDAVHKASPAWIQIFCKKNAIKSSCRCHKDAHSQAAFTVSGKGRLWLWVELCRRHEKIGDRNVGKIEFSHELRHSPQGTKKNWYTLCGYGLFIRCNLCDSYIKMRRPFDDHAWCGSGGHVTHGNKHKEWGASRIWREQYDEKVRILAAAAADRVEVACVPKKPKGQLSLRRFFGKKSATPATSPPCASILAPAKL